MSWIDSARTRSAARAERRVRAAVVRRRRADVAARGHGRGTAVASRRRSAAFPTCSRHGVEGLHGRAGDVGQICAPRWRSSSTTRPTRSRRAGVRTSARERSTCTRTRAGSRTSTNASRRWRNPGDGMSAVLAFVAGFMKKHVLGQSLVRRNPFYYERSRQRARARRSRGLRPAPRLVARTGAAHAAAGAAHRLRPLGRAAATTLAQLAAARQGMPAPRSERIHHRQRMVLGAGHHRRHQRRAAEACCVRSKPSCSSRPRIDRVIRVRRRRCAHGAHRRAAR